MIINHHVSGLLIVFTLGLGLILTLLPAPEMIAAARPAFFPATVLFWVLMQPLRFGIIAAWCCGIIVDVIYGTPFAEHGLALAVAAYAVIKMREILWTFPVWQQALLLTPVFVLYEFVLFWIDGVAGAEADQWWRWLPVVSTVIIWPVWAFVLERIAELEVR